MDKIRTEQEIAEKVLDGLVRENHFIGRDYFKVVLDEFERSGIDCSNYKKHLVN